jgi:abortive infection bacteriophage resistance protein
MKKATTVEEQIEILKIRGMVLDMGVKKAKEILSDIGYFRLGFYCFPFEKNYPHRKNRTHEYRERSRFSDAINLYYLDVDLRNILSQYINRIEINFRTNLVYQISNKYPECNTWFVDPSVMERKYIDEFDSKIYTDSFKKNPVIKLHHRKYINDRYAPAWKTLEFLTFGGILTTYRSVKDAQIKQQIAGQYGIHNVNVMENYMQSIVEIRNVCAHGGVLFDHTLILSLRNGPALLTDGSNKNKLFSVIQVLFFILNSVSQNRANEMEMAIKTLFNKFEHHNDIRLIIKDCMGYNDF